ncbi:hypothetical protein PQX77_001413, partial [Marasmius sp. AFHP31]
FISDATLPFVYRELKFELNAQTPRDRASESHMDEPHSHALQQLDSFLDLPLNHTIWKDVRKVAVYSSCVDWPGDWRDTNKPPYTL